MERLVLFMEKYGLFIFLALYVAIFLASAVYFRMQYKNVTRYYEEKDYQKCKKTIKFLSHFPKNSQTKQFLYFYKAVIDLTEDKYIDAAKNLSMLKSKRFIMHRLFWECYINLRLGDYLKAEALFNEYEKISNVESLDYQLLSNLMKQLKGESIDKDKQEILINRIQHPRLREFYITTTKNSI